jgi:hypothetical protein
MPAGSVACPIVLKKSVAAAVISSPFLDRIIALRGSHRRWRSFEAPCRSDLDRLSLAGSIDGALKAVTKERRNLAETPVNVVKLQA